MTRYFEITERDCAARIGRLMLDQRIATPAVISSVLLRQNRGSIIDSGCVWDDRAIAHAHTRDHDRDRPHPAHGKLLILPHRSLPLHAYTAPEPTDRRVSPPQLPQFHNNHHEGALGEVIHPAQTDVPDRRDLYVIGAAAMLEDRARLLVDTVLKLKRNTQPDTAIYAPGIATPENLSLLVYLGIDLVDDTAAILKGYQGVYLTREGEKSIDRLREFPCACAVCTKSGTPEELRRLEGHTRFRLLAEHNTTKLGEEMRVVRECIRDGRLREYVEKQCRSRPYLTAVLRLLDCEHTYLEERTPMVRKGTLIANTAESQNRVEVTRFAERVISRFTPPDADTLVILPCSARKPYSLSKSHAGFIDALRGYRSQIHEVVLTSPLGVVPRELERTYPAAHYDIAVTGEWSMDETAWVAACLGRYLRRHPYRTVIAHLSGGFADVCKIVERDLGIEIVYSVSATGDPTSAESLDCLRESVAAAIDVSSERSTSSESSEPRRRKRKPGLAMARAIADYQFGRGVGAELITESAQMRSGRSRRSSRSGVGFRIFADRNGKEIASSTRYGTLALTLEGAARIPPRIYRVSIDDFIPKSSVLAPGVIAADPQIRPMDEVIVEGNLAFGVGQAIMSGPEMVGSERGVAVDLRAVRKLSH
ncbi:MAG: tRNA-guanine transglycosylase [Methanosarcinales archaeon]|nr:tRNA-guanine transglycosylase [Methanosarcinales archaeon]